MTDEDKAYVIDNYRIFLVNTYEIPMLEATGQITTVDGHNFWKTEAEARNANFVNTAHDRYIRKGEYGKNHSKTTDY